MMGTGLPFGVPGMLGPCMMGTGLPVGVLGLLGPCMMGTGLPVLIGVPWIEKHVLVKHQCKGHNIKNLVKLEMTCHKEYMCGI